MKLLEVVEETTESQRLGAQIITLEALRLLARKLNIPVSAKRSYDQQEGLSNGFTQINKTCTPLTRDFALGIDAFADKFLAPVTKEIAAVICAAMPINVKTFECRALPMPPPQTVDMVYQACSPPDGIGLRFVRAYDIHLDCCVSLFSVRFRFE